METPVLIIGGGPAGAASALFLSRLGIPATIIEKDRFPRYHIGESLTGECGSSLHSLDLRDQLAIQHFPEKEGVKVYGQSGKNTFYVPVMGRSEDGKLTAASTYQVRRSTFDQLLLEAAVSRGAQLIEGEASRVDMEDGILKGVHVKLRSGKRMFIPAEVTIDASGRLTFLSNKGVTGPKGRGGYDNQVAIFSQFSDTLRDRGAGGDDTLIFYKQRNHWAWFIPLDDEIVSIGVVTPTDYFQSKHESKQDFLIRELQGLNPVLAQLTADAKITDQVRAISNYSYHIQSFTGPGFLCVGDSHRFIDPVFSFGVYFSIKEAEFAAGAIAEHLNSPGKQNGNPYIAYEQRCEHGQNTIQALIDAFWNNPLAFAYFTHYRYIEDLTDLFAGRVYSDNISPGLAAIHSINQKGVPPAVALS